MSLNGSGIGHTLANIFKNVGTNPTPTQLQQMWVDAMNAIYADIIATGVIAVTIPPAAIVTIGSAATQTGPATPVPLTGSIS